MTVAVAGLALVLVSIAALVATLGAVAVARHRAAAAADLAALSAARHVIEGQPRACEVATRIAGLQGALVVSCVLERQDVVVEVTVRPPGSLGLIGVGHGRARAGPSQPHLVSRDRSHLARTSGEVDPSTLGRCQPPTRRAAPASASCSGWSWTRS